MRSLQRCSISTFGWQGGRTNDTDKPANMAPETLSSVYSRPPFPLGFIPLFCQVLALPSCDHFGIQRFRRLIELLKSGGARTSNDYTTEGELKFLGCRGTVQYGQSRTD
ncbi:MAG: hypothetical protein KDA41_14745, partial [Planctomycetales bacterium]|nr:hypothetical protein [Planctomycetales bacterium]